LGLAFKPGTDDMRESPAIPVIRHLQARGASVTAFDPVATTVARKLLAENPPRFAESLSEAVSNADVILLVTRWPQFASLPRMLRELNSNATIIDGRRMIDPSAVARYVGIGLKGERS
ncbi:MAG: UDP binding domain-containing protein, partial [Phycisphaerae bacterium]|nr:UDP binding domain-containing protein [Phycisphaerae bacterium]